jgi:hypothetical protein
MRFSLKWALLVMTVLAIGANAIGQRSWMSAEVVWMVSAIAFCYAALIVCVHTPRRCKATGFALFWGAYFIALWIAPGHVPSRRILTFAGYAAPATVSDEKDYVPRIRGLLADPRRSDPVVQERYDAMIASYELALGFGPEIAASNAIGCLIAGLVGYWLASRLEFKT